MSKAAFTHKKVGFDAEAIQQSLSDNLVYAVGKDTITATDRNWFFTTAYVVRDHMIDRWMQTMRGYYANDAKRVYYFPMEFLMGRTLIDKNGHSECCQYGKIFQ